MTSRLGRINEAVRRRIQQQTADDPWRITLKTWRGQSTIVLANQGVSPAQWPSLTIRYGSRGPCVTAVRVVSGRSDECVYVDSAGVLDWLTDCFSRAYMGGL